MEEKFIPEPQLVERLADQLEQSRVLHQMELHMFPFNDDIPPLADWLAATTVTSPEFQDIIVASQRAREAAASQVREALHAMCAFSSKDWSQTEEDAWLYGMVLGWDGDPDDPEDDGAWAEVAERFGWDATRLGRLRRLHLLFQTF